jgi:hypothetical protein
MNPILALMIAPSRKSAWVSEGTFHALTLAARPWSTATK